MRGGEEEDSAEVNHKPTHRASGNINNILFLFFTKPIKHDLTVLNLF